MPEIVKAKVTDAPLLARMNRQLIEDEASHNPMSLGQLEDRMRHWLEGGWSALLIQEHAETVGYMVFQQRRDEFDSAKVEVYVRQFFIVRKHRNRGIGRAAFAMVASQFFRGDVDVVLDVLEANRQGQEFWESLGFTPYCSTMKLARGEDL